MRFYRVESVVFKDPVTGAWVTDNEAPVPGAKRMWIQWPDFNWGDATAGHSAFVTWVDEDA